MPKVLYPAADQPLDMPEADFPPEDDEGIPKSTSTYNDDDPELTKVTPVSSPRLAADAQATQDVASEAPDALPTALQPSAKDDSTPAPISEPEPLVTLSEATFQYTEEVSTPVPEVPDIHPHVGSESTVSDPTPQIRPPRMVSPSGEDLAPPPAPESSSPSTSPTPPAAHPQTPPAQSITSQTVPPLDRPFPFSGISIPEDRDTDVLKKSRSVSDMTLDTLGMLYFGFRDSVRKLASLSPPVVSDTPPSTDVEQQDARVEYSMTKSQIQLMADEEKLWEELVSPHPASSDSQSVNETLTTLSFRAHVMWQSYERRTNPPTTQTYNESKELLRAMGVPCVDTSGTYEAEALASAMVINGYADYVASEDTVCNRARGIDLSSPHAPGCYRV